MKINKKGFSLVETLIVMSITGVAVAGLFKASQQALVTSNVTQTQEDTRNLKENVYQILNNACETNLNPTNLNPVSTPATGLQKIKKLVFTNNKELFNFDPNDVSKNKKKFGKSIQVVDIVLKEDTPIADSSNTQKKKTFYLYYKYISSSLGAKQTKGGDPNKCIQGGDLSGCYYLSCFMNYECEDDCNIKDDLNTCNPLNCSITEINVDCPSGEFLVSLTGDKKCLGCPTNQILIGIKEDKGVKKPKCLLQAPKCNTGYFAVGTKIKETKPDVIEYELDCRKIACDRPGDHNVLVTENGTLVMKCKKRCHGGQILNEDNECYCPKNNPGITFDHNGNCYCTDADKIMNTQGACIDTTTP